MTMISLASYIVTRPELEAQLAARGYTLEPCGRTFSVLKGRELRGTFLGYEGKFSYEAIHMFWENQTRFWGEPSEDEHEALERAADEAAYYDSFGLNVEALLRADIEGRYEEERERKNPRSHLDGYDYAAMNEANLDKPRRTRPE